MEEDENGLENEELNQDELDETQENDEDDAILREQKDDLLPRDNI